MIRPAVISFILLLSGLLSPVNGQRTYHFSTSEKDVPFISLVGRLEASGDFRFFFDTLAMDTVVFHEVRQGETPGNLLERELKPYGFTSYREDDDFYILPGGALLEQLPDYRLPETLPVSETVGEPAEENGRFIQTLNMSKDRTLVIGRDQDRRNGNSCMLTGKVVHMSDGTPLIGATVYILEREQGAVTDVNGNFRMTLPAGKYTMVIDHMAMKEERYGLNMRSDGEVFVALQEKRIEIEEIMIVDKRRDNVEGIQMGFEHLSAKFLKEIPVVMGEKDILKVAEMLPGVQNAGEGTSGFNVRGGTADQNMFYINKLPIYNTAHLFGFFTAFSQDVVSDFSLYKNNIPAKYGGRIASVFEINTREGDLEEFSARGGISPVTGHVAVEGPLVRDKVTYVASFRSTYSDWLLNRIEDEDIRNSNAAFYDGTFAINSKLNKDNELKLFFYRSSDEFSLASKNDYSYQNTGASATWESRVTDSLGFNLSFAMSDYGFMNIDRNNPTESFVQDYNIGHYETRADFTYTRFKNQRIEFGVTNVWYDLNRGNILPFGEESRRQPVNLGKELGTENSVYLSDEIEVHPRLTLLLGFRYSLYWYLGPASVNLYKEGEPMDAYSVTGTRDFAPWETVTTRQGFEPRAAMNFRLSNNSSVKASYNRLNQYLFMLSNTIAISPTDQWKLTDYHLAPPRADQLSVGFYKDFDDAGINFSVEAYRKWINNVVEYRDWVDFISGDPVEMQVLEGVQRVNGVELILRKTTRDLTGWISYAYSRSVMTVDGPGEGFDINGGIPYPSNYDRPHSFNLVANYRMSRRLSFSSNVVYSSGRPTTLPVAIYYIENQQQLYYSARNSYRLPDYFRVDLSINLEGNLKSKKIAHSFWMLSVYNLTGRTNAYSVFYEARNGNIRGYKLSVFGRPIITLSYNLKFGNYASD